MNNQLKTIKEGMLLVSNSTTDQASLTIPYHQKRLSQYLLSVNSQSEQSLTKNNSLIKNFASNQKTKKNQLLQAISLQNNLEDIQSKQNTLNDQKFSSTMSTNNILRLQINNSLENEGDQKENSKKIQRNLSLSKQLSIKDKQLEQIYLQSSNNKNNQSKKYNHTISFPNNFFKAEKNLQIESKKPVTSLSPTQKTINKKYNRKNTLQEDLTNKLQQKFKGKFIALKVGDKHYVPNSFYNKPLHRRVVTNAEINSAMFLNMRNSSPVQKHKGIFHFKKVSSINNNNSGNTSQENNPSNKYEKLQMLNTKLHALKQQIFSTKDFNQNNFEHIQGTFKDLIKLQQDCCSGNKELLSNIKLCYDQLLNNQIFYNNDLIVQIQTLKNQTALQSKEIKQLKSIHQTSQAKLKQFTSSNIVLDILPMQTEGSHEQLMQQYLQENKRLLEIVNSYEEVFEQMREKEVKLIKLLIGIRARGIDIEKIYYEEIEEGNNKQNDDGDDLEIHKNQIDISNSSAENTKKIKIKQKNKLLGLDKSNQTERNTYFGDVSYIETELSCGTYIVSPANHQQEIQKMQNILKKLDEQSKTTLKLDLTKIGQVNNNQKIYFNYNQIQINKK